MKKELEFDDGLEEYRVKEYKESLLASFWDKWLIFKISKTKDWQKELKKHLPPYFDGNVNKINEFSMRENCFYPPCPQEFLEHLLNGIILRNELGLYQSKYFFYKELQQLLIEYLKLFYFRMDAIIDIFQTNTKLSVSKEKFPKIVVKCSNCNFYVFINVHCPYCQNEFYCDETCQKIHYEVHKKDCINCTNKLPKIIEPLRIEVHLNSQNLGEIIEIYNEHNMKFSKFVKGKTLLSFLYKTLSKDIWYKNNNYIFEEYIQDNYIVIKRNKQKNINLFDDNSKDKNANFDSLQNKDFVVQLKPEDDAKYKDDEYRDMLRLSVLQELKLSFYKLGALIVDILCEQHSEFYKFILIFYFP